jgi:membrane-associated protease RseP (regulator of RpoE activity)
MTLLHELGHALPALAFGRLRVVLSVGWQPTRTVRVGRLELRVRLVNNPR